LTLRPSWQSKHTSVGILCGGALDWQDPRCSIRGRDAHPCGHRTPTDGSVSVTYYPIRKRASNALPLRAITSPQVLVNNRFATIHVGATGLFHRLKKRRINRSLRSPPTMFPSFSRRGERTFP
jgi:hypothetical protein